MGGTSQPHRIKSEKRVRRRLDSQQIGSILQELIELHREHFRKIDDDFKMIKESCKKIDESCEKYKKVLDDVRKELDGTLCTLRKDQETLLMMKS